MKKLLENKYFIIGFVVLIIAVIGIIVIKRSNNKLTDLEKVKINETSNDIINYLPEVVENKDESAKYISFAIEYLYNNEDRESFSIEEILDVINNYFEVDYTIKTIADIGITPYLADKGIVFDRSNQTFTYEKKDTRLDLASQPIVKYELKNIKKINKKNFKVIYTKYLVTDPYKILNYYNNLNIASNKVKTKESSYEIAIISNYLKGLGNVNDVIKLISKDNISDIGEIKDDVEIEFVVIDGKLKIKKIK